VKRNRANAALLLLVLGLGTLVWLSERESPKIRLTPLTKLLPEQINSIRISNQSGPAISMRREANGWRMIAPYAIEANSARIERLLEIAGSPVHTQFEIEQSDLTEFGLAPAAALLHLERLELRFGGTDPIDHYRYIAIGNRLHLIKDLFPHLLLATAESYVSPNILPQDNELDLIQTPEWRLARSPDAARLWQLTPAVTGISMDRLIEKVDEWKNAQAVKVIKAPAISPDSRVEIRLSGSDTLLAFGILRHKQGTLVLREDLGLAYDLPRIETLLSAPTEPTGVP